MTTAIDPTSHNGYGWRMTDSDRLNARLDAEAARRAGRRTQPRPFSEAAAQTQIVKHMRSKRLDLTQADRLMREADERIQREHREMKSSIMLGRLPAMYREADFPRTDWGLEGRRWVDAYRNGSRAGLVILGNIGTGKTWLSAAIARSLMVHDKPVPTTLIAVPDLFATLRAGVGHELGVDLAQFATAPVLILDDLGQEMQSAFTTEQLFRLAHARNHNGLPTIVTSNLDGPAIRARYEARTFQRLFGGSSLVQIPGESLREMPF